MTRDELITLAYRSGIIGDKETPSTEQISLGAARLAMILRRLPTQGLTWWTYGITSIPYSSFSSNVATVATSPVATKVYGARRINVDGTERIPVDVVSRKQYMEWSPYVNTSVAPTEVYVHVKPTNMDVYVWPGMGDYTLELDVQKQNEIPSTGATTLVIPDHWQEAILQELVVALGPTYGMTTEEYQKAEARRRELVRDASEFDAEPASYFFTPRTHE